MTVGEVMEEVMKDTVFYDESGGGVTFSGGEPLLQHEFLLLLLEASHSRSMHTAVDTTGHASSAVIERISPLTDLFLYDIKLLDNDKFRKWTGVSNHVILENLRLLTQQGKQVVIRMPIIPGVNDDPRSIMEAGAFIASLDGPPVVQLLPYHKHGLEKYRRLGINERMGDFSPPSLERLSEIVDTLHSFLPHVSIGG